MALDTKQLTKLENLKPAVALDGRSRQLWWYESADAIATVAAAGYFNTIRGQLGVGDQIIVVTTAGITFLKVATIPADGSSNVTVATSAFAGKTVRGQATTVTASDTIATGLTTVLGVVATLDSDPVAGCQFATASVGDQAGAPAAGSFLLKTWKDTATADTAKIAATTFGKKVNYIAWGV